MILSDEEAGNVIGSERIITNDQTAEFALRLMSIIEAGADQSEVTQNLTAIRQQALIKKQGFEFDRALKAAKEMLYEDEDFIKRNITVETGFTYEDFVSGEEPYKRIMLVSDPFRRKQEFLRVQQMAKSAGVPSSKFAETFRQYQKSFNRLDGEWNKTNELPEIPNSEIEVTGLYLGDWRIDNQKGVWREGDRGDEVACLHPIIPIKRLINIDTNVEKLETAFFKGGRWKTFIAGKNELFDASKIIKYSEIGVSVTSKSAKLLSQYLCEMEGQNYSKIPEIESISRLGFIGDGKRFSPYMKDVVFDGEANYTAIYGAVAEHKGSFEVWRETALKCRSDSLTARIILASSFASVLLNKIGALCFFTHLWGVDSGTGKTVALMLAASVWGDPEIGAGYVQTFNATQVGHEKTAAFLNNIPMCIDELQLSKDSHGHTRFDVYQLAQGVGRTRGTKTGGIDNVPRWNLCIITTGESPIVSDSSGAGAVNRVIDIECRANDAVIRDGAGVSKIIKQNYGYAGEKFVEALTPELIEETKTDYEKTFAELCKGETTEKQAMAAAMIITADKYAEKIIFKDGTRLSSEEMSEFLKTKASVSAGQRGYEFLCGWVAANINNFVRRDEDGNKTMVIGQTFGAVEYSEDFNCDVAYINSNFFNSALSDKGYDARSIASWLKTNNLLELRADAKGYTKTKKINGTSPTCYCVKLPKDEEETAIDNAFEELVNSNYY